MPFEAEVVAAVAAVVVVAVEVRSHQKSAGYVARPSDE
jgi:hypothetical protein